MNKSLASALNFEKKPKDIWKTFLIRISIPKIFFWIKSYLRISKIWSQNQTKGAKSVKNHLRWFNRCLRFCVWFRQKVGQPLVLFCICWFYLILLSSCNTWASSIEGVTKTCFIIKSYIQQNKKAIHARGAKLERYADKMRGIMPKIGWLLLLYLVCVLCQYA